jgi:peptidoglycan/xylan/chitin deacetylase (PgdA/CDA1 family)
MRIRGIGTARLLAKKFHGRFGRPGPLILGYHRIAASSWDPQQLCVSPQNFEEQLEVLTRTGCAVSLRQFVNDLKNGKHPKRAFVVTFDDGYADTLEVAGPILGRHGVPATAFVPTGMIGRSFWWDDIQNVIEKSSDLPEKIAIELGDRLFRWKKVQDSTKDRASLVHSLCAFFRSLPNDQIDNALTRLREIFEFVAAGEPTARAMTSEQISELSGSDLFDVGSHTVTHTPLDELGVEDQSTQLRESKAELEDICGSPVVAFAYPNGRTSAEAPGILGQLGYECGVTSNAKPVMRRHNPYLLPRSFVGDWDGDSFSDWLGRWLR